MLFCEGRGEDVLIWGRTELVVWRSVLIASVTLTSTDALRSARAERDASTMEPTSALTSARAERGAALTRAAVEKRAKEARRAKNILSGG